MDGTTFKRRIRKRICGKPEAKLVRELSGLDPQAANEAFSEFLSNEKLNSNQIREKCTFLRFVF